MPSILEFPRPAVTVDVVILTVEDLCLKALLVQRDEQPFRGAWALPGGFVRVSAPGISTGGSPRDTGLDEGLDEAAQRILNEEAGLPPGRVYLEQLQAFGGVNRDPRMRVITIAYFALVGRDIVQSIHAGQRVLEARWYPLEQLMLTPRPNKRMAQPPEPAPIELDFDHSLIVETALGRVRTRIEDSDIAFELVQESFTIAELRAVHEVILGSPCDPGNFRRKFQRMVDDGIVEKAPGRRPTASKPASLFRFPGRVGRAGNP